MHELSARNPACTGFNGGTPGVIAGPDARTEAGQHCYATQGQAALHGAGVIDTPVSLLRPLTLTHSTQWLRLLRSFMAVSALCRAAEPDCSRRQAASTVVTCMGQHAY